MIVQCESCRAQFDVEDVILRPAGRKLKCSQCQAVFFQPPPKSKEGPSEAKSTSVEKNPEIIPVQKKQSDPIESSAEKEILQEIFMEDDNFLDDDNSAEPQENLSLEEADDGLDGSEDLFPNDLFGDTSMDNFDEMLLNNSEYLNNKAAKPQEISAKDAFEGFSESFSNEVDEMLSKEGLIDTYMHNEGEQEQQKFEENIENFSEDAETIIGPKNQLALAKPTKRELEQARLAKEKLASEELKKKSPPVIQEEKKEPFIHMDDDEPELQEPEEPEESKEPEEPVTKISKKIWLLSLFLLLTLGAGLATLTDWWTYKQFDLASSYRLSATQGQWRRYPFGLILLVDGSVTNTSRTVQMVPGIRVVLLNPEGQEIASSLAYPGRVIDDKMLDESSETALRAMATLQSEDKSLKMNKLPAGGELPFQVIFVQPAQNASRYRLQLLLSSGKEQTSKEQSLPARAEKVKP